MAMFDYQRVAHSFSWYVSLERCVAYFEKTQWVSEPDGLSDTNP